MSATEVRAHLDSGHWNDVGDVYVLRSDASGLVKIGVTRPEGAVLRARDISSAVKSPLTLLAVFRARKRLEQELHALLAPFRVEGEWFSPDEGMLAFLMALPSTIAPTRIVNRARRKAS